jgi:hypothetical protein
VFPPLLADRGLAAALEAHRARACPGAAFEAGPVARVGCSRSLPVAGGEPGPGRAGRRGRGAPVGARGATSHTPSSAARAPPGPSRKAKAPPAPSARPGAVGPDPPAGIGGQVDRVAYERLARVLAGAVAGLPGVEVLAVAALYAQHPASAPAGPGPSAASSASGDDPRGGLEARLRPVPRPQVPAGGTERGRWRRPRLTPERRRHLPSQSRAGARRSDLAAPSRSAA